MQELDLEGDWDPDAHDRQMSKVYGASPSDDEEDLTEKPTWDDDIDIGDIAPDVEEEISAAKKKTKKDKKKKKKKDEREDEGVDLDEMDADAVPREGEEDGEDGWDGTEEMRKRKLDEYMDEVYGLEFNDMVSPLTFLHPTPLSIRPLTNAHT